MDVLIPVRNRARFIAICLDSVRAQTLQPNAVIVVDDGSIDETPEVLAGYARRWSALRVIRSEPHGVSHARNLALAASRASYVAFLDSDDVWLPEKLERQMALFRSDKPQIGFVHCACFQIDETGRVLPNRPVFAPSHRGDVFDEMVNRFYHISGSASAVVARRDLVVAVGGFDEGLAYAEDRDVWLKLARISHVDFAPEALVGLRSHGGGSFELAVRNNPELVLFQTLQIWNKWFDHVKNKDAVLKTFRRQAVSVTAASPLRQNSSFGLYDRLKRSDLDIARRLFPSRRSYASHLLLATCDRVKFLVATRLILQSRLLVRCCQLFGKFRNMPGQSRAAAHPSPHRFAPPAAKDDSISGRLELGG